MYFECLRDIDGSLQQAVVAERFPIHAHPRAVGAVDAVGRGGVGQVFVAVGGRESPVAGTEVAEERAECGHAARDQGEVVLDAAFIVR